MGLFDEEKEDQGFIPQDPTGLELTDNEAAIVLEQAEDGGVGVIRFVVPAFEGYDLDAEPPPLFIAASALSIYLGENPDVIQDAVDYMEKRAGDDNGNDASIN